MELLFGLGAFLVLGLALIVSIISLAFAIANLGDILDPWWHHARTILLVVIGLTVGIGTIVYGLRVLGKGTMAELDYTRALIENSENSK